MLFSFAVGTGQQQVDNERLAAASGLMTTIPTIHIYIHHDSGGILAEI